MQGIGKSFGPVRALEDVALEVERGTIHALVGENGAGKTTLMRILYGAILPSEGDYEVALEDVLLPAMFRNSSEAIRAGIGMVSQHYSIIPDLTCLENLILGAEPGWAVNRSQAKKRAQELAIRMGFQFEWDATASTLSPAGAQKLEILKLLWRNSRVMILDEPTAMLSPADSDALYESLKTLAAGGATVIIVTHRLPEVMAHCHRVTVLRGGKFVADRLVTETNPSELAELIVGHSTPAPTVRSVPDNAGDLLTVQNLVVLGDRGDEALKRVSFNILKGEVLGLAGVDGSGQRELLQALIGERKAVVGEVLLGGLPIQDKSVFERLDLGLRLIPEDRHDEGVMEGWSLELNSALGMQQFTPFASGPWVQGTARSRAAGAIAERFKTKHAGLDQPISSLSGGNQQRFVAGRALFLTPRLILAFQPARGLDIDATRNVYEGIYEECEKGAGALVVSFDLDELIQYCDRVVVLNLGRLFVPAAQQRAEIGRLMVGAA